MKNRLIGRIVCAVKGNHIMCIGPDRETWERETERQMKVVGYCDCFCDRCGKPFIRFYPGPETKL